jgi:hypothetical protein
MTAGHFCSRSPRPAASWLASHSEEHDLIRPCGTYAAYRTRVPALSPALAPAPSARVLAK